MVLFEIVDVIGVALLAILEDDRVVRVVVVFSEVVDGERAICGVKQITESSIGSIVCGEGFELVEELDLVEFRVEGVDGIDTVGCID